MTTKKTTHSPDWQRCEECGRRFDAAPTAAPWWGGIVGRYAATTPCPGERYAYCDRCLMGDGPASPTCRVYTLRRSPSERRKAKYDAEAEVRRTEIHLLE